MALLAWNDKYCVGVKALDDQHKILLGLLNEFHAAMMRGDGQAAAGSLLRRLKAHVQAHIATEERLMASCKFPGLVQHQARHRKLLEKVEEFIASYEKGESGICIPLLHFLHDWHTCHWLQLGREYLPYLPT